MKLKRGASKQHVAACGVCREALDVLLTNLDLTISVDVV